MAVKLTKKNLRVILRTKRVLQEVGWAQGTFEELKWDEESDTTETIGYCLVGAAAYAAGLDPDVSNTHAVYNNEPRFAEAVDTILEFGLTRGTRTRVNREMSRYGEGCPADLLVRWNDAGGSRKRTQVFAALDRTIDAIEAATA